MKKAGKITFEILKFLLGIGIFSLLVYVGARKSVEGALSDSLLTVFSPDIIPIVLSIATTFGAFFLYSLRWGYIANSIAGKKVCSSGEYFHYFISGFFSGQFISQFGGTLVVRPGMLSKKRDISYRKAVSSVFLEKIFDFILVLIMIVPCLLYVFQLVNVSEAITVIVCIFGVINFLFVRFNNKIIIYSKTFLQNTLQFIKNKPLLKKIYKESYNERIEGIQSATLLKKKTIFIILQLTALKYILLFARLYFLIIAFKLSIPASLLFLAMPVAQLSLLFAFTPGSIGVLEAGWFFIFNLFGTDAPEYLPFLMGQRIYWFISIALFFLFSYCTNWYINFRKNT